MIPILKITFAYSVLVLWTHINERIFSSVFFCVDSQLSLSRSIECSNDGWTTQSGAEWVSTALARSLYIEQLPSARTPPPFPLQTRLWVCHRLWATRCQFHQRSTYSFYAHRSQKRKKILTTWLSSYALGNYRRKSCT